MQDDNDQTGDAVNEDIERESLARRNLLRLGGIAVAGAVAAAALDASPAAAGVDGDVVLSDDNTGNNTHRTGILANYASNEVFGVFNGAASGCAVRGRGHTDSGNWQGARNWAGQPIGVFGESGDALGAGVVGDAPSGTGVQGESNSGSGVLGKSNLGTGVRGESAGIGVSGEGGTGVHGEGVAFGVFGEIPGPGGAAVLGQSSAGTGVGGVSTSNRGVHATSVSGPGIEAQSSQGPAVLAGTLDSATQPAVQATSGAAAQPAVRATGKVVAAAAGTAAGHAAALVVQGRAAFTRSGVLTIPAGATNALTPLVAGGLAASAHVLATVQENKGTVTVRAAVPITAVGPNQGKIQIFLTGAVPAAPAGGLKVAWFVFG